MIHYHGMPITPATAAMEAISGGHALLSLKYQMQVGIVLEACQSFMLDNGAFSAWSEGTPISDWEPYYRWVRQLSRHPGFDFAVIPDVIDGDEYANDALLANWPLGKFNGAPVWHMHESLDRLKRLCDEWPRVCLGSSGEYRKVNSPVWWDRMHEAMDAATCGDGLPYSKLHGLRMLDVRVFTKLPLASADSTNIGRNIGIDKRWNASYAPPTKEGRARLMRWRIENENSAGKWERPEVDLFA